MTNGCEILLVRAAHRQRSHNGDVARPYSQSAWVVGDGMVETAIVVVNYGSSELLEANLPVALLEESDSRLVVVDNFSTEAERRRIEALCSERGWHLVLSGNDGFGCGCNRGVATAAEMGCEAVVLLNPDAVITSDVVQALAEECETHPESLIGVRIENPAGGLFFRGSTIDLRTGQIKAGWIESGSTRVWCNWISGACLATSVMAYERLGGMDDDYFMYWEDVDFSVRAHRLGLTLRLRLDLMVTHDEGGTQPHSKRTKSDLYYRYNARNRLLFAKKLVDSSLRWRWFLATPSQSLAIWMRGGRRQLLSRPSSVLATLRGTIEGLLWRQRGDGESAYRCGSHPAL